MSLRWASALTLAEAGQPEHTIAEAARSLSASLQGFVPDLLLLFITPALSGDARELLAEARRCWPDATIVGCSGAGVLASGREVSPGGQAGGSAGALVIMAGHLPDVAIQALHLDQEEMPDDPKVWQDLLGVLPEQDPVFIVLPDPFSVRTETTLSVLDDAFPGAVKLGGLASGGRRPRQHVLFGPDGVHDQGMILLCLTGDLEVEPLVAQGCRPVGPVYRVTRAAGGALFELDGRSSVEVLDQTFTQLPEADREGFRRMPLVGLHDPSVRARAPRPSEFLVRNLVALDRRQGAVGVGATLSEGQLLQFQLRDPETSSNELRELLRHRRPVSGVLMFSCLGRGAGFFGEADHESRLVRGALGPVPLAGFFCNGEIGPVGGRSFLHTQTSTLALMRARGWS